MDYIKDLHELCDTISEAIGEANEKIRSGGGKLSAGDVDYVDKLTHALKSVKATIAMMEDEGYSSRYPDNRGSYRGSYARRRDSMGRYSRNNLADKMRDLMDEAPDDHTKREIQRMVEKLES